MVWAWLACGLAMAEHAVFVRASQASGPLSFLVRQQDRIDAHFFQSSKWRLVVLDEGNSGSAQGGSLAAAMRHAGCSAGINGGYFAADSARTPLGLLKHRGRAVTRLASRGFTVAGALYDTGQELKLERSLALTSPVEKMQEAIQGGPFLIENGSIVKGLDKRKQARRTFIATNGKGLWCMAVSSPLSLHGLAEWLASPGAMGDFKVQTALNLDGGSSSAFWDASDGTYLPGLKPVRNYIGIIPRPGRKANNGEPRNRQPAKQKAKPASRK